MQLEGTDISAVKGLNSALGLLKVALERIEALERENLQLKERIAKLEKNSSTSSKPPSSDITKPESKQRQPGKRKSGAQPGHKQHKRELLPSEQVDHIHPLELSHCPKTGKELRSEREEEVIEGQLFGPRLQALIAYMKGNLGASYTELEQYCRDVLGVEVSRGLLCKTIERVSEALRKPYEELAEALPKEESLNVDETGWKDCGKRYWAWLFCNRLIAYFTIQSSRGSKVLREVLGETFSGALISDFYSAYVCYANDLQQFCLAHLIRDIKFLTTLPDAATQKFGETVLKHFKLIFRLWHRREEFEPDYFVRRVDRLQRRLYSYLHSENVPKGKATTMKKRLVKHWDSLFKFVRNPELYQPTNNLAEQTLRALIRIRRQSQGSRSSWGRLWTARCMTVLETCRKQKRSSWKFLYQAVRAYHFETQAPSLLSP